MRRNLIAALWFLTLLCAPLAGHIFAGAQTTVSLGEKRALAALPTFKEVVANPEGAPARVNAFLEDHFGFRDLLIVLYFRAINALDLDPERRALRGEDGWLFDNLDQSLAMHQGLLPLTDGDRASWVSALSRLRDACDAPFAVMFPPNKHTVYREYLSRFPPKTLIDSRRDELSAALRSKAIIVADPLPALLDAKRRRRLYYKTDTHWTAYGAYLGYESLMAALRGQGLKAPVIDPARLHDGETVQLMGDLPPLLGEGSAAPEIAPGWLVTDPSAVTGEERLERYDFGSFEAVSMRIAVDGPRLLLIGDSFSTQMTPFLKESFSKITIVHHRNREALFELVQGCDHDALAFVAVERSLSRPFSR